MQQRSSTILTSVALIAIVAVIGLIAWQGAAPSAAQTATTDSRKRITVSGLGQVNVVPDVARISIGVQTEAEDANTAVQENNTRMQAVIDQLKAAGIEDKNIQTSSFNISPRYDYDSSTTKVTGYIVSNMINVKVPLAAASGTLDSVISVGANNINGIYFEVSDPETAMADARKAAIDNARVRAEQYAAASGAEVGEVLVISEIAGDSMPLPIGGDMLVRDEAAASVPIQGGEQTQRVSVTVTFALK